MEKLLENQFFRKQIKITFKKSYAKHWGKQIFAQWRFPEVGKKQKMEERKERKRERERLNDGNNNGQATHGARMGHAWRTQAAWAN